ncbi:MAG TPA: nucleoside phosphorylase [Xanthobacteraceae bacterium]
MNRIVKPETARVPRKAVSVEGAAPLIERADHVAPSVFLPENLLREARRQKGLAPGSVPPICMLDPDGDIVAHVQRTYGATTCPHWACYHTQMWRWRTGDVACGIVGHAVGGSFAVLVAEQLFASGCELLVNVTSAGQITDVGPPPYYILIERALRDEGTSYHYLPAANYAEAEPGLLALAAETLAQAGHRIYVGDTWTTDAPFRETEATIARRRHEGILAVEMEAASLYAFAAARARPVICLAHVSNQLGCVDGDFEKGDANGAAGSLDLVMALAAAWRRQTRSTERVAT